MNSEFSYSTSLFSTSVYSFLVSYHFSSFLLSYSYPHLHFFHLDQRSTSNPVFTLPHLFLPSLSFFLLSNYFLYSIHVSSLSLCILTSCSLSPSLLVQSVAFTLHSIPIPHPPVPFNVRLILNYRFTYLLPSTLLLNLHL